VLEYVGLGLLFGLVLVLLLLLGPLPVASRLNHHQLLHLLDLLQPLLLLPIRLECHVEGVLPDLAELPPVLHKLQVRAALSGFPVREVLDELFQPEKSLILHLLSLRFLLGYPLFPGEQRELCAQFLERDLREHLEALLDRFLLREHVSHQADHDGLVEAREVRVLLILLVFLIGGEFMFALE
jgi:hypothetical protein